MSIDLIQSQENPLTAPADEAWDRAIAGELGGQLFQRLLKFKKGEWLIGENPVGHSDTFLVNPAEWWVGWVRWEDGKPAEHIKGRAPAYIPPARESLGPGDWERVVYLGMKDMSDGDILAFASGSEGGRRAVAELMRKYRSGLHKYRGQVPRVLLKSGTYTNQYGLQYKPIFQIASWSCWDDAEPTPLRMSAPDSLPPPDHDLLPVDAYEDYPL